MASLGIFETKEKEKTSAVRPNAFFTIPSFIRNEDAEKKGVTDEERILASGAQTEFWKTLKTYIVEVTRELDQVNNQAIAQGVSLEEIGRNTVVINLTKGVIERIFNIVEDARESVEEAENGK